MWTNKQVWEFEEINENLTFDMLYVPNQENIMKIYGNQNQRI